MGDLLSEIREINNPSQLMINQAPSVMQEVRGQNFEWVKEFTSDGQSNQEHNMLTNDQAIREVSNLMFTPLIEIKSLILSLISIIKFLLLILS